MVNSIKLASGYTFKKYFPHNLYLVIFFSAKVCMLGVQLIMENNYTIKNIKFNSYTLLSNYSLIYKYIFLYLSHLDLHTSFFFVTMC